MEDKANATGCLPGVIAKLLGGSGSDAGEQTSRPTVRLNKKFVSESEAGFFRVLREVVGKRGHVLAQVALNRLVSLPKDQDASLRQRWQNKVAQRSVDFVVCEPATLQPRVVIELDEPSHGKPKRQDRDAEVEMVLEAAGLPVVRVLASRSYDTAELESALAEHLDTQGHAVS